MACLTPARSVVGMTSTVAVPAKDTNPRLIPGVSLSANSFAATFAASSRLGSTSVAFIDSDTSIVSITVARLRGIRCSAVGPVSATVSRISATPSSAGGTCFHQPCRREATRSSTSRLLNRNVSRRRRPSAQR